MLHTHHHPQMLLPLGQGAKSRNLSKSNALSEIEEHWIENADAARLYSQSGVERNGHGEDKASWGQ